jgi:hypothetical protein
MSVDLPEYRDEGDNRTARKNAVVDRIQACQATSNGQRCVLPFGHEAQNRAHVFAVKDVTPPRP